MPDPEVTTPNVAETQEAHRAEIRAALRLGIDVLRERAEACGQASQVPLLDPASVQAWGHQSSEYSRAADVLGGLLVSQDEVPLTTLELLHQLLGEAQLMNESVRLDRRLVAGSPADT